MKNVTVRNRTETHRGVLGCCPRSYQTKKRMRYQATTKSQHGHCAYQCIYKRGEKWETGTKNAKPKTVLKTAKRKYKLAEEEQPISTRTCRSVYRKGVLLGDPIVRLRCVGMHLR